MEIENTQEMYQSLLTRSEELEGGMGAIAFAVLEMFRLGGLPESEVQALHEKMKIHFMKPTNEQCNAVLKMVETRLRTDKEIDQDIWYA